MKITVKVEFDGMTIGVQSIRLEHLNFSNLTKNDLLLINSDIIQSKNQIMSKLAAGVK